MSRTPALLWFMVGAVAGAVVVSLFVMGPGLQGPLQTGSDPARDEELDPGPDAADDLEELRRLRRRVAALEATATVKPVTTEPFRRPEVITSPVDDLSASERAAFDDALAWLKEVHPRFADLTPEELWYLRDLNFTRLSIEDEDLAMLVHLPSLKRLTLTGCSVTDQGLEHVKGLPLLELGLRDTKVTDAGLPLVAEMRGLQRLDLNMLSGVTNEGLMHVGRLENLTFLRLNYTGTTGEGLRHLKSLSKLERLDAWAVKVTDAQLMNVYGLPSLNHLELGATSVSKKWVDDFKAAHPTCYVRSKWGR
ncbi:MAG: hypothetical protein CL908_17910 [Deltaproteobacteria bacterium]|nr:hypothetical protein [Deltaproteobacteria bacterium]